MNYNDENSNLSQSQWKEMADEYEKTLHSMQAVRSDVIADLHSLLHILLTSYPNLSELKDLNIAIKNLGGDISLDVIKKSFFSTPLTTINSKIFALSNKLILSITNANYVNVKNVLSILFKVGSKVNESKRRNKW